MTVQFENIYYNQSKYHGKLRVAEIGLGWKVQLPSSISKQKESKLSSLLTDPYLLPVAEILTASWSRGCRGYECRVQTRSHGVVSFDGFDIEDLDEVKNTFKRYFNIIVEPKEHSVRGWNWGSQDFERNEIVMSVGGKPQFEIPYADVNNVNLVGKTEVAVELNLEPINEKRFKSGDELVEVRFFIPGFVSKSDKRNKEKSKLKSKKDSDQDVSMSEDEEENSQSDDNNEDNQGENEEQAATIFYETLKDKADIGVVVGETIVSFADVLFLTPRGRFDIDMFRTYLRLRGKTYDYKIQYSTIQRLFLLPKPDDVHNMLIIQLDPPVRQGQTRYPFLVLQFLREEEIEVELNLDDKDYEENYKDRLKRKYDQAAHEVVGQIFRGLSGRRMIVPGSFQSAHGKPGVKCSLKASEGWIYPLEKSFIFVPKPTVFIPMGDVSFVTMSRVGAGAAVASSSRTFDLIFTLKNGTEQQFSNINREEQSVFQKYITSKGIKVKNDLVDEQTLLAAALADTDNESDDGNYDRGSADDSESVDEDYTANSDDDDDIQEEYDEDAVGSSDGEESDEKSPPSKRIRK